MKLFAVTRGGKKSMAALARMDERLSVALGETLAEGALMIQSDAIKSIQAQASKGERVTRYKPKREVTVSRPGDPPNSDTGRLAQSITIALDKTNLQAYVGTNVRYGAYLEFGSQATGLEPRPWLRPAAMKNQKPISDLFRKAMANAVRRLKSGGGA